MINTLLKKTLRYPTKYIKDYKTKIYIQQLYKNSNNEYDFERIKNQTIKFIESMKIQNNSFDYLYSENCTKPTLYASVYACMTYSLLGELKNWSMHRKKEAVKYFDLFQNSQDGLFYDPYCCI